MPIVPAIYSTWQFWDGRADSLWAQALGPIENPLEHGFTRLEVARVLASRYREPYEQLFGRLPDLSDRRRFPLRASPNGDAQARAAWLRMAADDRRAVDELFSGFGKSIAAFERTLKVKSTRFDRFVAGVVGAGPPKPLLAAQERGLRLFIGKGGCLNCHSGPMLSNGGFANTGVPARADLPLDEGRISGARQVFVDPFNCKGAFSDAQGEGCDELEFMVRDDAEQVRAFKVPSLRGVTRRAPYMHAGQIASLAKVIQHYDRAPRAVRGTSELTPLRLSARERSDLLAFLTTLDEQPHPAGAKEGEVHAH